MLVLLLIYFKIKWESLQQSIILQIIIILLITSDEELISIANVRIDLQDTSCYEKNKKEEN